MKDILLEKKGNIYPCKTNTYLYNNGNTIQLFGSIDNKLASSFISDIYALEEKLKNEENQRIKIIINSPGGEVYSGLAIMDVINDIKKDVPVDIICFNIVASMAAVIASCGTTRKAYKNTKILIHEILIGQMYNTNLTDVKNLSKQMTSENESIAKILVQNTKKDLKTVLAKLKENEFMSAQEAKKFGLIDEII